MDADPTLPPALVVAAAVQAAPATRLAIIDPNDGQPILGVVVGAISATHVSFRADDGLIWPVATAALRPVAPSEGTP